MIKLTYDNTKYFAWHYPDQEDIYINISNLPARGYKQCAKRINYLVLIELICSLNPFFTWDDCNRICPITRIMPKMDLFY